MNSRTDTFSKRNAAYPKTIRSLLLITLAGFMVVCLLNIEKATAYQTAPQSDSNLFSETEPNFSGSLTNENPNSELLFKVILSIGLVSVFGVASIYISKRFLPKLTMFSGKKIKVVETVYLGPRKAVHLLQIEDRSLLIGSTNNSITKLADLSDTAADFSATYLEER